MIVHEHVYFILQIGTDAADIVAEYVLEEAAENDEYATGAIEDNEATFQVWFDFAYCRYLFRVMPKKYLFKHLI